MNDVRLLHQVKAHFPIFVTELGIVTEVRNEQLEKAYSPILVTELGIVTEVRLLQKAYLLLVDYQYYTL